MSDSGLGQIKHCVNIDREGGLPFLVADLRDLLERGLMRGVVDENVDGPELVDRAFGPRFYEIWAISLLA